jgi:hypothetical protein
MSNQVSGSSQGIVADSAIENKRNWASGFRRLQIALAWWGTLILLGGWLHNSFSLAWGNVLMLLMWLGITALGFAGNYLLASAFVNSGVAFMWGGVITLGFLVTLLVLYPLGGKPWPALSVTWHLAFALGYLLNGYFSDRRLWRLSAWELLMALLMLYVAYNPSPDPTNPLSSGAHPIFLGSFNFYYNQGLLLGLTTGIPLLIAALPFWRENYSRG